MIANIQQIRAVFPHVSEADARLLLLRYENEVETLIDHLITKEGNVSELLAQPLSSPPAYEPKPNDSHLESIRARLDAMDHWSEQQPIQKETVELDSSRLPTNLKSKVLQLAKEMTYEDDEYDDSYDTEYIKLGNEDMETPADASAINRNAPNGKKLERGKASTDGPWVHHEKALFEAYSKFPKVFQPGGKGSVERKQIVSETRLTDRLVEQWGALMESNVRSKFLAMDKCFLSCHMNLVLLASWHSCIC
jgi:hypothetical protein